MKSHALTKLTSWEQFDLVAASLSRLGWNPTCTVDGPDARSWTFVRQNESLWLVFDDVLGGALKSEDTSVDLAAIAAEIQTSPPQ